MNKAFVESSHDKNNFIPQPFLLSPKESWVGVQGESLSHLNLERFLHLKIDFVWVFDSETNLARRNIRYFECWKISYSRQSY